MSSDRQDELTVCSTWPCAAGARSGRPRLRWWTTTGSTPADAARRPWASCPTSCAGSSTTGRTWRTGGSASLRGDRGEGAALRDRQPPDPATEIDEARADVWLPMARKLYEPSAQISLDSGPVEAADEDVPDDAPLRAVHVDVLRCAGPSTTPCAAGTRPRWARCSRRIRSSRAWRRWSTYLAVADGAPSRRSTPSRQSPSPGSRDGQGVHRRDPTRGVHDGARRCLSRPWARRWCRPAAGHRVRGHPPVAWQALLSLSAQVHDHLAPLGLDLRVDEAEGYAFLVPATSRGRADRLPRLVARRPLSFRVSLLLALLRRRLPEFDAHGGDKRLIVSRDEIVEMVRMFLPAPATRPSWPTRSRRTLGRSSSWASSGRRGTRRTYEVRRIIKAFVDGQWLGEFDGGWPPTWRRTRSRDRTSWSCRSWTSGCSGFRLQRLEVRNWGTFDRQVWSLASTETTASSPATSARGSRRWSTG